MKRYLTITFRLFTRKIVFSIINLLGLSTGIACVFIILSWVKFELSYDRYHQFSDRIYRVERPPFSTIAPSFIPLLKQDFPVVEEIARVLETDEMLVKNNEKSFVEKRLFFAEEDIFKILSVNMLAGDINSALSQPKCIVLSESMSFKYFGSDNPMGKTLMLLDTLPLRVTGIIRDIPPNSHFHFDFLVSYLTLKGFNNEYFFGDKNFGDNCCLTYLRLREGADLKTLEGQFPKFIDRYIDPYNESGILHLASESITIKLKKVTDIHLHSHTNNEVEATGDIKYVRIFSLTALFILLIACINFINLSIAKGIQRGKEVALKKTFGSGRLKIILEYITDSFLYTLISFFLAMIIYETVVPYFSRLWQGWTGQNFFTDPVSILLIAGILIFTGLLAGLYPAIYLSGFKPIQILKKSQAIISPNASGIERGLMRKSLVIIQFSISIAVMIGIGVINKQMKYLQHVNLGYDRENILMFPADEVLHSKWDNFKQELLNSNVIEHITMSKRAPTGRLLDDAGFEMTVNGNLIKNAIFMPHNRVEHDFFRTYGIKIVAGRDFDRNIQTDATEAAILNEKAITQLGFKSAEQVLGSRIKLNTTNDLKTIIGVCSDFHYESLHNKIPAIVTYISMGQANTVAVRFTPGNPEKRIREIQNRWEELHNDAPFEFTFLDELIDLQYKNEQRMLKLFNWFGIIAIFIACLGLYGLSAYTIERRTKEIGIRKANGATTKEIMLMLSTEFSKWVIIAFLLASPISYYFMNKWLQNFAYKTSIDWIIFLAVCAISLIMALITISWQSFHAANKNPVEALRYE